MPRFLAWLTKNQIAIHYSSINLVYWSIVDIVDSIMASIDVADSHAPREIGWVT
jgi:hypothetical protein